MEHYERATEKSTGVTLIALLVGVIVFIAVWIIGAAVFYIFDDLRGLGNDKLQAVFRELFVPGVGGYLAMLSADSWFKRASMKFVFLGFSAIIMILVGVYIGFVGPVADKIGEDIWGLLLSIVSMVSAVVGAYLYAKDEI